MSLLWWGKCLYFSWKKICLLYLTCNFSVFSLQLTAATLSCGASGTFMHKRGSRLHKPLKCRTKHQLQRLEKVFLAQFSCNKKIITAIQREKPIFLCGIPVQCYITAKDASERFARLEKEPTSKQGVTVASRVPTGNAARTDFSTLSFEVQPIGALPVGQSEWMAHRPTACVTPTSCSLSRNDFTSGPSRCCVRNPLLPLLAGCCRLRQGDSPASTGGGSRLLHWSGTNLLLEGGVSQRGTRPSSLILLWSWLPRRRAKINCRNFPSCCFMSFVYLQKEHRDSCVGCSKKNVLPWRKQMNWMGT